MALTFIDLGLPSGTLWATENAAIDGKTYFNFNEAVEAFGDMLPLPKAWKELFNQCSRKWNKRRKGYVLTGPNANTIFLPANGFQNWNKKTKQLNDRRVYSVGDWGHYWSSTPYGVDRVAPSMYFSVGGVIPQEYDDRLNGFSVRLCKPAGAQ